jgi:hypothetical protein
MSIGVLVSLPLVVLVSAGAAAAQAPDTAVPYREFPEREGPRAATGALLPDPAAPRCVPEVVAPSAIQREVVSPDPHLAAVRLALPQTMIVQAQYRSSDGIDPATGSYLLALFRDSVREYSNSPAALQARYLSMSIVAWPGYATMGADTATRQTAFAECQLPGLEPLHLIRYSVLMPTVGTIHYATALWRLGADRYLHATASSGIAEHRNELVGALLAARVVRSTRPN